jgi:hypothetical protein
MEDRFCEDCHVASLRSAPRNSGKQAFLDPLGMTKVKETQKLK